MHNTIQLRGVRVHNLKNLDVDLPRNKLIVITGVSGSGKSSLAFDTLYAEGQRRYVESLSAYARQFLERMDRPDVDEVRGISPAVAIEQKNPTKSSRSTVATATEIHDYLRLLFARIGKTYCPECGDLIKKDRVSDVVDRISNLSEDAKIQITFPLASNSKKEIKLELQELKSRGFYRFVFGEELRNYEAIKPSDLNGSPKIRVLVDRLKLKTTDKKRLADSLELAFREGHGRVEVLVENQPAMRFSQAFECSRCQKDFIEPQPRLFSFNNPFGACPTCRGFGEAIELDLNLVIPDDSKSLEQGAVAPWNTPSHSNMIARMREFAQVHGIDLNQPWRELPEEHRRLIIEGGRPFPGIRGFFQRLERKKYKIGVRVFLSRYRGFISCPDCHKTRLRLEALFVQIAGKNIGEVSRLSIAEACTFFRELSLTKYEEEIARQILQELRARLNYLAEVGLGYLTLDRRTQTLSGGEYQRINLATAVGFKLTGSLYVLDEPSIGLHPRDNERLIKILLELKKLGNTVVVVEHDRDMMQVSDQLIDLGPRAGENGGELVYQGTYRSLLKNGVHTLTADYLKNQRKISVPKTRRSGNGHRLKIVNAHENNLKHLDVEIPLGMLTVVTGVSGSGKSTLVHEVLYTGAGKRFGVWKKRVGKHGCIAGLEHLDGIVLVDQSPIGRTPRSNPVTYTKSFDGIRELFAQNRRAKALGFKAGTFSFNAGTGRCPRCEGAGVEKIEMQFLADLLLPCEICGGKRFKKSVLEIQHKGKNIHEVLNLTVTEALIFFKEVPKVVKKLQILDQVGLGYLRLGQPAPTLSGGEAQRLKLAAHLAQKPGKHLLYLFDEPTTGLHFHDIAKLLNCFQKLIDAGNSVLVIEHNMEVIKCADYVIDLGPEGGDAGGYCVAAGTPEEISQCQDSFTAKYLKSYLSKA
ncbi:MAG: excinuclease ABC subunit UvrA [bacterium]